MKRLCSTILLCSVAAFAVAQDVWRASDIADSLKREAYSVVRDYQATVTASSKKSMTTRYRRVVTILNKKGDDHALWNCTTDDFSQLTSFSGKIYDEQGRVKQKLKRSDVHTSQFSPVWYDRQALEKASFKVTVPTGTKIRYMGLPHEQNPQKQGDGKNDVYVWNMPAMRCLIDEEYDDHSLYICPSVIAIPYEFVFGESSGILDTWENKGKWYYQLAEGRGTLLPADKQKVKELTANCTNDKEKIAALYKYLGEKTRYVSIQLGIGGWQPMKAEEVGKTGFGDCKALTNYMQALLKEAGIESCQTIISTRYSELLKDFPNMHQTNHVILTIPQADGSNMVVECTNPQLPLGFVSGDYAGHQALQVVNGMGKLIRIPEYTPDNNYETLVADVQLQADGKSVIKFSADYYGERYEGVRSIVYQDDKKYHYLHLWI